MKSLTFIAALAVVGTSAAAQSPVATAPQESPAASATDTTERPAEPRICRRLQASTGSRISGRQRVCLTARQWREYERNN